MPLVAGPIDLRSKGQISAYHRVRRGLSMKDEQVVRKSIDLAAVKRTIGRIIRYVRENVVAWLTIFFILVFVVGQWSIPQTDASLGAVWRFLLIALLVFLRASWKPSSRWTGVIEIGKRTLLGGAGMIFLALGVVGVGIALFIPNVSWWLFAFLAALGGLLLAEGWAMIRWLRKNPSRVARPGNLFVPPDVLQVMPPTKPDPSIELPVRAAYMELMNSLSQKLSPEESARLRADIQDVWFPRERQAFGVSIRAVGFIQSVTAAHGMLIDIKGASPIKDSEFAAALLMEYLALAEGIFKLHLCHIAVLAAFAGEPVEVKGVSPRSHADLIRSDVYVEHLASVARQVGFAKPLDMVFDNHIRRSIAHMDLDIGSTGSVTFFDTDREGGRTPLGPPRSIGELNAMNFRLRDFSHSLSNAIGAYAAGERGFGPAG